MQNDLQHDTLKSLRTEQQLVRLEKGKKRRQLDSAIALNFRLNFSQFLLGSLCGPSKIAKPTVFQVVLRGIGKSFQSAITAPRIILIGYGNATAQS